MKKIEVTTSATIFDDFSQLSSEDQSLMQKAIEARKKAYAPYSKFKVGAALLLDNGIVILGNNQENAAYPSGMCAERVAIWKAGSEYPNLKVKKIAITAASSQTEVNKPVGPCGACRQTLSEYEINQKEPIEILFMGEVGQIVKTESLLSLLPFSFDSSYL
ncbi:cytidine deaminase [Tenacibaculum sp. IB213877]|uniref:cytidine deaminase n=1 Tax=Tenacibaculum sp. IB213877 TaxID=3097351 RepID=UPI002A59E7C0|nr:cytidine deaminase [Tenacibaculum sp. IB213877]MDY0781383.1 cytidine deaminase [Tenacibaculum sp. IB213877]